MAEAPRTPVTPGVSGTPVQPPQLQQQPYGNGNNNIIYSPIPPPPFILPPPDTPPAPTFNSQFETPSPPNQGHDIINNPQLHNKPKQKNGQLMPTELFPDEPDESSMMSID